MRKTLFVIVLLLSISLNCQVIFELNFSFEKINNSDERRNFQLFDQNEDNIDELFVGYNCENNWKLVCYDLSGDTLSTYSQEKLPNETFSRFFLYKDDDVSLLLTASILEGEEYVQNDSLLIQIINLENYSILQSINYSKNDFWINIFSVTSIVIQKIETEYIIHLGYYYADDSIDSSLRYSDILRFNFDENGLTYIETISKAGLSITYNELINKFVSHGLYQNHDELSMSSSAYYYLKLIDCNTNPSINTLLSISGSCGYDIYYEEMVYYNWPQQFRELTINDMHNNVYGPVYFCKTYTYDADEVEVTNLYFKSFTTDLQSIEWEEEISTNLTESINATTCVSVNNESHFFMYFRNNYLEIRNRLSGEIIHSQEVMINPFTILRKNDGELLFFVEQENENGYDVYILNGEIQVSSDENKISIISYELQNHPNPFNPLTTISFNLPEASESQLEIYNIKGQKIKTLLHDQIEAGEHSIVWNGEDAAGKKVSSGIYLYKLKVNDDKEMINKCILLK